MTHQKLPCRFCGMNFEIESDRREHESCHVPVSIAIVCCPDMDEDFANCPHPSAHHERPEQ